MSVTAREIISRFDIRYRIRLCNRPYNCERIGMTNFSANFSVHGRLFHIW